MFLWSTSYQSPRRYSYIPLFGFVFASVFKKHICDYPSTKSNNFDYSLTPKICGGFVFLLISVFNYYCIFWLSYLLDCYNLHNSKGLSWYPRNVDQTTRVSRVNLKVQSNSHLEMLQVKQRESKYYKLVPV